ncbi:MAG: hypothetical protein H7844_14410 [Nitrospirae bacterium YQR-1]
MSQLRQKNNLSIGFSGRFVTTDAFNELVSHVSTMENLLRDIHTHFNLGLKKHETFNAIDDFVNKSLSKFEKKGGSR